MKRCLEEGVLGEEDEDCGGEGEAAETEEGGGGDCGGEDQNEEGGGEEDPNVGLTWVKDLNYNPQIQQSKAFRNALPSCGSLSGSRV